VYPQVEMAGTEARENPDRAAKQMKRVFAQTHEGEPFFADVAKEALEEDFAPNAEELQQEVLDRLRPKEERKKQAPKKDPFKPMLLDAIRVLAGASRTLQAADQKISDNVHVLDNRKLSLVDRIRRFFERVSSSDTRPHVFELEYFDEATSATQTEELSTDEFSQQLQKKARIFGGILNKMSQTARKLENANEEQLFDFLNRQLEDLHTTQRRIQSLETAVRAEFPREQRGQFRSLQTEVDGLKDVTSRAGKKRREYVAKKEEAEQMKKLGIEEP
jgi:hypothetical protein